MASTLPPAAVPRRTLPRVPAGHGGDARRLTGEGATPLVRRAASGRDRRPEPAPQDRGPEPDGLVQGPWHGPRGREGARGWGPQRHLASTGTRRVGLRLRRRSGPRVRGRAPAGKIAVGKLLQALVFGARTISVSGNFDEALRGRARAVRAGGPPDHARQLGQPVPPRGPEDGGVRGLRRPGPGTRRPAIPVGNAGNISAYWRGFREYREAGRVSGVPRHAGGSRPPGRRRSSPAHPIDHPETVATAIRIGNPALVGPRGRCP